MQRKLVVARILGNFVLDGDSSAMMKFSFFWELVLVLIVVTGCSNYTLTAIQHLHVPTRHVPQT
jgi:hypothetical protein